MKLFFALFFLSFNVLATSDANTRMFILVRDVNSGEYYVEKAPLIGCYGVSKGPELAQLTLKYIVPNIGCGMNSMENINALTCAKVAAYKEADDYSTFSEITLDVSHCEEKSNPDFINAVKKVVQLNFSTKTVKKPVLTLVL